MKPDPTTELLPHDPYRMARERRVQELAATGMAWDELIRAVADEFQVLDAVVREDLFRVAETVRRDLDDERLADITMRVILDASRRMFAAQERVASIDLGDPSRYTPGELGFILKQMASAGKNALSAAETIKGVIERRSPRWSPKVQVDVDIKAESPEHQAAVLRLLGRRSEAEALLSRTRVPVPPEEEP